MKVLSAHKRFTNRVSITVLLREVAKESEETSKITAPTYLYLRHPLVNCGICILLVKRKKSNRDLGRYIQKKMWGIRSYSALSACGQQHRG